MRSFLMFLKVMFFGSVFFVGSMMPAMADFVPPPPPPPLPAPSSGSAAQSSSPSVSTASIAQAAAVCAAVGAVLDPKVKDAGTFVLYSAVPCVSSSLAAASVTAAGASVLSTVVVGGVAYLFVRYVLMDKVFTLKIRASRPDGFCDNPPKVDMRQPSGPHKTKVSCESSYGAFRGETTSRPE